MLLPCMKAECLNTENSIIYKRKACNSAIQTQSFYENFFLSQFFSFSASSHCQICKWNSKNEVEREREYRWLHTESLQKAEEENEKHYLQFNFTYDYFVLRFVPIMLKLWIIWCYRRGYTSRRICYDIHATRGSENVHCRCKYIKNYFNIKTCFDVIPQKGMNNKEAFGSEDTGSLAKTSAGRWLEMKH